MILTLRATDLSDVNFKTSLMSTLLVLWVKSLAAEAREVKRLLQ